MTKPTIPESRQMTQPDEEIVRLLQELTVSENGTHGSRLPVFVRSDIHSRIRELVDEARREAAQNVVERARAGGVA